MLNCRPAPASGPAMLPGPPAARPCSAAILVASPRRARGAQRPRPGCRPAPRPGRGRNAHNRHSGWPPRSAGNSLPQPRSARCRTVPGRGPQARSGSPAPLPPRVPGAARRPPRCPGRAIRGPAGTTCTRHQAGPVVHPTIADLSPGGNPGRPVVLLTYVQILPSGHGPATPGSAGLALEPFRGVRYAQERVTGLAEVTSPPYDVIAHDTADKLLAADRHNVVRLILPRQDPGRPGGRYGEAARLLREWQHQGVLVPDARPALYVYEQHVDAEHPGAGDGLGASLAGGPATGRVVQRGLIGALRLAPPGSGIVLPHEDVMPGPVTGRRQLMEATWRSCSRRASTSAAALTSSSETSIPSRPKALLVSANRPLSMSHLGDSGIRARSATATSAGTAPRPRMSLQSRPLASCGATLRITRATR